MKPSARHTARHATSLTALLAGRWRHRRHSIPYQELYGVALVDRMAIARNGIAPEVIDVLARDLRIDAKVLIGYLGIRKGAFERRRRERTPLNSSDSEHLLGALGLVGQVQQMVELCGDPREFDPCHWTGHWISTPLPALGNRTPSEFLDTIAGQALISQLLSQNLSAAFA